MSEIAHKVLPAWRRVCTGFQHVAPIDCVLDRIFAGHCRIRFVVSCFGPFIEANRNPYHTAQPGYGTLSAHDLQTSAHFLLKHDLRNFWGNLLQLPNGEGLILIGESGVGKSNLARELLEHTKLKLIADDQVLLLPQIGRFIMGRNLKMLWMTGQEATTS